MEAAVLPSVSEALQQVNDALDVLALAQVAPVDIADALDATRGIEVVARRVRAAQIGVVAAVDRSGVHRADAHRSAAAFVGHAARLKTAEAKRRASSARALAAMPLVAAGLAAGEIGIDHVDRIARTFANPRVQERFSARDDEVAALARRCSYDELDRLLTNWEAQVDEDGTADRARANHQNRDAQMAQDFDGGWQGRFRCGSLDGAELLAIFDAFVEAEFQADWAAAREEHGDATTVAHLARTDAQRRFDAFSRIFHLAVDGWAAEGGGPAIVVDLVMAHEAFERHLRTLAGESVAPVADAPIASDRVVHAATVDGRFVDPTEAAAAALVHHVRRVVVGSEGVVVDLGRRQRLFTGAAQVAAQLLHQRCYWPGCQVPTSRCQTDHLVGWRGGGTTDPANGAPCCGFHNRAKEAGFTVRRDRRGRIRVHRPDGSQLE